MNKQDYELSLLIGVDRAASMWSSSRELQGSYNAMADWHLDQGHEELARFYRVKAQIVMGLHPPVARIGRLKEPEAFEDAVEYHRLVNLEIRSVSIIGWDSQCDGHNVAANVVMANDSGRSKVMEIWPVIWHGSGGLTLISEDTKCCFWFGREPRHILGVSKQGWRSVIMCKLVGFVDMEGCHEFKQYGIKPIELVGSMSHDQTTLVRDLEDTLRAIERATNGERRQLALWGAVFDYTIDGISVSRSVIRQDTIEYQDRAHPYYDLNCVIGRDANLTQL